MARCAGCSSTDCNCFLAAGDGIELTGVGSEASPWVIAATSSGGGSALITVAASDTDPAYAALADFVCDGVDDDVEINQAIEVSNSTLGGYVFLLPGTFYTTDTVYPTGTMVGSGAYGTGIRYSGAGSAIVPNNGGVYLAHFKVEIQFAIPMPGKCIESTGGDCVFDHLHLIGGEDTVVTLADSDAIRNCYISGTGLGIIIDSTDSVRVQNNRIFTNNVNVLAYDSSALFITNNFIGGSGSGSDGTVPEPYDFYTDAASSGITLIDCDSNVIEGNRVYALPGSGIYLNNSNDNLITSNMIESFGQRQPGSFNYAGIHIANSSDNNNVQTNMVRSGTFINSKYGLRIESNCWDNFTSNNDLYFSSGQSSTPVHSDNYSDNGMNTIRESGNRTLTSGNSVIRTYRKTANYSLTLPDAGCVVEMNVAGANNLTVPTNATIQFPIGTVIEIMQYGAGQTTIVAAGGVTIRSPGGKLKIAAQYGGASLRKIATNEWALEGNLTA